MTPTPHFHSHAEQQAMLGCAADFNPNKHPRRAAQLIAKQRFEKESRRSEHDSSPPGIQRARQRLEQINNERRAKLAEKVRPLAENGATIAEMADVMNCTRGTVMKLLSDFNIERGPQTKLEA